MINIIAKLRNKITKLPNKIAKSSLLQKIMKLLKALIFDDVKGKRLNFATLCTNIVSIITYCGINTVLAKYQGIEHYVFLARVALGIVIIITFLEIFSTVSDKIYCKCKKYLKHFMYTYPKIFFGILGIITLVMAWVIVTMILIPLKNHFGCTVEYYTSIVEMYGIPVGVGKKMEPEELKESSGYWEIRDYPSRKRLELTYREPYGQLDIMKEYSTAYGMKLFQVPSRIVYNYTKNEDKYRSYDLRTFEIAEKNGFRDPEKITYYNNSGKLLMKLESDQHGNFSVTAFSSSDNPQLLNSTLFRTPDEQTEAAYITSKQIETTYNSEGLPETRRFVSGALNAYGVNGERYVYDKNRRLRALYYLDANGEYTRNSLGIMMLSIQYNENSCSICYYSDEKEEQRTEGFYGVFCERFLYDSSGNITKRLQLNRSGKPCLDNYGIHSYNYKYDKNMLCAEVFKDILEKDVPNKRLLNASSVIYKKDNIFINHRLSINFDSTTILTELPDSTSQDTDFIKSPPLELENSFEEDTQEDRNGESKNREEDKKNPSYKNTVQSLNEYDTNTQTSRNYSMIQFLITSSDHRISEIRYCGKNGELLIKEKGYAVEKPEYDSHSRIKSKKYYDINSRPCSVPGGYAEIRYIYSTEPESEPEDTIEQIDYLDFEEKLTINQETGYASVKYDRFLQDNYYYVIRETYLNRSGKPVPLSKENYATLEQIYDDQGALVRESYYNISGSPVCRADYGIAMIMYQTDTANENRRYEWYKDIKGEPANRKDTGYARIKREFQGGCLSESYEKYQDNTYQPATDKTTGVHCTKSFYENYKKMREEYYSTENKLILHYQIGCAIQTYSYNQKGELEKQCFWDAEDQPVISKEYHCAALEYEYDDRGNQNHIRYLDKEDHLMIREDLGYAEVFREYDEFGNIRKGFFFDANGQPAAKKEGGYSAFENDYEGSLWMGSEHLEYVDQEYRLVVRNDIGYSYSKNKYNEFGQLISQSYFGTDEKPIISSKYHCAGVQYEYDENRNQTDIYYIGLDGKPMNRKDLGYAHVHQEFDEFGNIIKGSYFDSNDLPTIWKEGRFASYESTYKNGNWTESRYYDTAGHLTLRSDYGYAVIRMQYDEYGQCISEKYYGTFWLPIVSTEYHCAGFRYAYDDQGNKKDIWYTGLDGKLINRSDLGYAHQHQEFDELGNIIKVSYFDTEEHPVIQKEGGYASYENIYENGLWKKSRYYDITGNLTLRKDYGYAIRTNQYDELGRLIRSYYLGTDLNPIISSYYKCAGFRYAYDELGNETDIWYLDTANKILSRSDLGFAHRKTEYDIFGNIIKHSYYDTEDEPTLREELGCASYENIFENGNWIESRYYDIKGKLTLRQDYGYAILQNQYDEFGQLIDRRYLGTNGVPIVSSYYQCAGFRYQYDEKGNETDVWYLGTDSESMVRDDLGVAHRKQIYDSFGNVIKTSYFDHKEKPALYKDGKYSSCENTYQNGNITDTRYFDTEGKLTLHSEYGYAVTALQYDMFGQCVSRLYYGTDQRPILHTESHCAGFRYQYDGSGNQRDIWYIGLDSTPMNRRDLGYAHYRKEYDEFGNTLSASFFDSEEKPAVWKKWGYSSYTALYENGNQTETQYYDVNGNLTPLLEYDCAVIKKEFDSSGNCILETCYGAKGQPVIIPHHHCAGFRYKYDTNGNQTDIWYLGLDGELINREDLGYAHQKQEFDELGNNIKTSFFDTNEQPAVRKKGGYVSYESIYKNNNCIETRYYDDKGNLILRSDYGYAIVKMEYDSSGNCISEFYYGTDERPIISTEFHCAGFRYQYDADGNKTDIWYLGLEGELINREDLGYAHQKQGFDESGNRTELAFFDTNDKPAIWMEEGYASSQNIYKNDKWIESRYFDLEGNFTLRTDTDYAIVKLEYDSFGQFTSELYYGTDEQPIISSYHHCAGFQYGYDDKGNKTDVWYLGLNKEIINREDLGYAHTHWEFDDSGRKTAELHYDAEGELVSEEIIEN